MLTACCQGSDLHTFCCETVVPTTVQPEFLWHFCSICWILHLALMCHVAMISYTDALNLICLSLKKKQAEETVIYSFLLDLHVFVWKKCFVCYSMYTIFQDVNTSSYFQIMYSISWEWMHFRLIELKLTDIIFLRSPPFRTFLGKMIYSLLVVPKSSAIKTTSTWMKVVSVVMRLAPISRVLYVVHLKLLCSHLKNMWTLYLIVILNMMMMMMIKWFSNEEKNYIFVKCALNERKKETK